jgi:hypothetical protein
MRVALLAILFAAGPVLADPLVDLPTLFSQHADKVVVKDNGTTVFYELSLDDGVVTRCKGDGFDDCVSIDANNRGATTDCALVYAARTLLLTRSCQIGGAGQRFMLEKIMNQLGEHVAQNAVPPRDWPDLLEPDLLEPDLLEIVMDRAQKDPLPACEGLDGTARRHLASRLGLEDLMELQAMTAAPRLPVGKCLD